MHEDRYAAAGGAASRSRRWDSGPQRLEAALSEAHDQERRIRRRRLLGGGVAAVAAAGGLTTWGLASHSDPSSAAAPSASDRPVRGGTLVYLDAESSRSTQPQAAGTWQDSAYLENITDRLVWKDPETGEIQPYIAESWHVSEDATTYTFRIREGVTYSDHTPLDAASVKRNLEWQARGDERNGIQPSTEWPRPTTITSEGSTVTVRLRAPYNDFLDVLSGWGASLVADRTINAPLETQQQITGIIGSGPFVVESEKYGERIVFARRTGYDWAPPGLRQQGEALLERVEVHAVTDDTTRLGTLRSGEADAIRYIQPADERNLADEDGFQVLAAQGIGATNQWHLRQSIPALQDVRVRRALQVGIDRKTLLSDLYTDNWSVARSVVTEDTVGFVDQEERLAFDPDTANGLLDEAGYDERDDEGYRTKDGERLSLVTVIDVYDATAKPLYQLVQSQLKELGVQLILRDADYSQVSEAYAAPDVAMVRSGWPYPAPWATLRTIWETSRTDDFAIEGGDPALDELLADQATAKGERARASALADLQEYVVANAYTIPLLKDSQIFAAKNDVNGLSWSAEARPLFYSTWLDRP
ncbi:ABC transporter substrate-binding protein [Brachybacterium endophyticum]|nr:ABC transporter substrate-binding protein [Brachybacterium endophyticum]